jgi:hypothetical protein
MKKQKLFYLLPLFFLPIFSYSQGVKITPPKLEFDGRQLLIGYDFMNTNSADQFYVWVEMEKRNGEAIKMKALSGDVGTTKAGKNKQIKWIPASDSVFLNEVVSVEVKAEKYVKSYSKGSMMLLSTLMPGLGQTKISKGKPYWLTGVAAYGALAGGFITHQSYLKTYDTYSVETDPLKRKDLFDKTQKQMNMSGTLIITGAAIWVANLLWVAATPNKYQPLKHVNLTINQSDGPFKGTTLLKMRLNF